MVLRAPESSAPGVRRVLLAEDDPEMRALLCLAMRRDGYEVIEATDGAQLLVYLESLAMSLPGQPAPDIIVSDIHMPGYSGLDLLSAMREANLELPVILITAFSDKATRGQAERFAAILLDKPLDIDDLRRVVRSIIA